MARSLKSKDAGSKSAAVIDATALRRYVDRVRSLMEDRKAVDGDIGEVLEEATDAGFTKKHIRLLAREAMMDQAELHAEREALDRLRHALGEFVTSPLGAAAMRVVDAVERGEMTIS